MAALLDPKKPGEVLYLLRRRTLYSKIMFDGLASVIVIDRSGRSTNTGQSEKKKQCYTEIIQRL